MTQIPPRFSHYQALRRDNPDLFYKLSTQRQMRDSLRRLRRCVLRRLCPGGSPMKDILTILETAQRRYDGYELSFRDQTQTCLVYLTG